MSQRIIKIVQAHGFNACLNYDGKVNIFIPYTHTDGDGIEAYIVETLEEMYLALGY